MNNRPDAALGGRRRLVYILALLAALSVGFTPGPPALAQQAPQAVVATQAPDFSSGAHALVNVDPVGGPRAAQIYLAPTPISDVVVAARGQYFYRIERFMSDSVAKFDAAAPAAPIWQYSTLEPGTWTSNNPQDLIFIDDATAVIPMYEGTKAWIVNLNAGSQAEFKIGELDLSNYADSDGIPEMHKGVVVGGRLFLIVQRLDRNDLFRPSNPSFLVVFDLATGRQIPTGKGLAEGTSYLSGIHLPGRQPTAIAYSPENHMIYLACAGQYPGFGGPDPLNYTGGIVAVDPDTFEARLLVDDGDAVNHPYGAIAGLTIVNAALGYFIGYADFGDTSVYPFDPVTGQVGEPPAALAHIDVTVGGSQSLAVDKNGLLWVANRTELAVVIMDPATGLIDEVVPTGLAPDNIAFLP